MSKPGLIERFLRWLRLADYDEAKQNSSPRYPIITKKELDKKSAQADFAMKKIENILKLSRK